MALTKEQKAAQLKELKDSMQKTQSLMFAHYIGLKVSEVSDLRAKLKKENAEMKVAKKTLMQIAAKELGWPELPDDLLDGAVACIFSFQDPLSGAQVAYKFGKTKNQVELIGGIFEGKLVSKKEAMAIGQIPGKLQLLGMFMAMCNGPLSSFARGLSEIAKQKEAGAPKKEEPAAEKKEEPAAAAAPAPATETPAPEAPAPAADAPASAETPSA